MQQNKKWDVAIESLLTSETITGAAKQTGVHRATLIRWTKDPDFQRRLREARNDAHGHALGRVCRATNQAASLLIDGMGGTDITRMQYLCAKTVLETAAAVRTLDIQDLLNEISETLGTAQAGDQADGQEPWLSAVRERL